jgi:cathepsin L
MNKQLLLIVAVFAVVSFAAKLKESAYQSAFTEWMQTNKKSYHHDEFMARYRIFKSNMDYVNNWNAKGSSTVLKINKFADLSNAEFKKLYLGVKLNEVPTPVYKSTKPSALPDTWDWNKQGAVTAIKNQGQCGSCWSFSTTGSTEGCHYITTKKLVSLSEQNLMDCSTAQGNQGCNGGLMTQAMQYIISNKGIDTESSYPYTAEDGTCSFNAANVGATLSSFTNVNSGDEGDLQAKVYQGPTSVAIDASQSSFQFYSSGVYSDPSCSSTALDHGVLAYGWGTSGSTAYWAVKNSWGTDWGQAGFIWMARNDNNMCGIATMATLPSC